MTGLEMLVRYYAVMTKWVFAGVRQGKVETVAHLVSLLPGFQWNSQNQTLRIYDAELEERSIPT